MQCVQFDLPVSPPPADLADLVTNVLLGLGGCALRFLIQTLAWTLRTGQPLLPDLTQHCQLLLQLMWSHAFPLSRRTRSHYAGQCQTHLCRPNACQQIVYQSQPSAATSCTIRTTIGEKLYSTIDRSDCPIVTIVLTLNWRAFWPPDQRPFLTSSYKLALRVRRVSQ